MVFHVFEHNYIIYEYIHNYFYTIVPLITTSMAQGFLDSCTNVPILSNIENVIAIYYNSIVYIYGYGSKKLYIYIYQCTTLYYLGASGTGIYPVMTILNSNGVNAN